MESLYLKYRPENLDDIIGQDNIIQTLKNASLNNRFSHAYLFSGHHGCGKTSTARILAKLLTCENIIDVKTCGKCKAYKTISDGISSDVKEMDAATNRGIEDVKLLKESSFWSPQELKRKIFIIDEVHQLSKEAISSLLKILEEPPSYLTFILCTTDVKKILPTILSRCQKFNFTTISSDLISKRLLFISEKEKIKITNSGSMMISKMAQGSMRDAVGYLEQLSVLFNNSINEEEIQKYFGIPSSRGIIKFIKFIIDGNIPIVLDYLNDLIISGAEINKILYDISDIFRKIMILKIDNNTKILDINKDESEELLKIGKELKISQLIKLSYLFSDIEEKNQYNINKRWIAESVIINCIATLSKK